MVGLGGIGSLLSLQLAHLGVGEFVLLDGDVVEASNLSRVARATKDDVGRTHKIDVAASYAESLGLVRRVERYPEFIGVAHEALLASCDAIVSCVDRQTPRPTLNRLAYRHLVPVTCGFGGRGSGLSERSTKVHSVAPGATFPSGGRFNLMPAAIWAQYPRPGRGTESRSHVFASATSDTRSSAARRLMGVRHTSS